MSWLLSKFSLDNLQQVSTWKGIVSFLTVAGVVTNPHLAEQIITAGVGVVGLINFFVNEKKK